MGAMNTAAQSTLPARLGRYELLELIGKGGMAEVFKARLGVAAGHEKIVCIKRILPELADNSEFIALFVSEAKTALPLTHGNITHVFDFGHVDGAYYLAMEYVHGQNLARVLRQSSATGAVIDPGLSVFIASEVCRGLQYAHGYTGADGRPVVVVHRDVSPQNVLISYNGEVKLTDFGIALAATVHATGHGAGARGKPCYLAPEQARGQPATAQSDIFALGVVLYELLTNTRPFEGSSDAETLERVQEQQVAAPSTITPRLPAELDTIVLKAMHKDPAQRYRAASELQVDLARVLHSFAPHVTADNLAQLMRSTFGVVPPESEADALRERLLQQLSRAGVDISAQPPSTDELLQMATVAIRPAEAAKLTAGRRPWRRKAAAAAIGLAVALVSAAVIWNKLTSGADQQPPATVKIAATPPIEHLLPPSLQQAPMVPTFNRAASDAGAQPRSARSRASRAAGATEASATTEAVDDTAAQTALLNCNSWPWSVVYLNGKRLRGNTPLYGIRLKPGWHRIRFVNTELGLSKEVKLHAKPGLVRTIAVRLQPEQGIESQQAL